MIQLPFNENVAGAETSYMEVVFRQPEQQGTLKRMENAELRLRYLLDYYWRGHRKEDPFITPTGDTSIGGLIYCQWERYMAPATAQETWVRYIIAYNRNVPK